jgi:TRAP-type C4-dicarboxylate transport system permease small subunit
MQRALSAACRAIVGCAIFIAIAINLANIIGRYVFLSPIFWAEEILNYLMVWCVFVGAVLVTLDGRHIKMDLISAKIGSPPKEILHFVIALVFLAACGFVILQSWTVTSLMLAQDQRSMGAGVPLGLAHLAILLGYAGMLVAVALRFRTYVTNAFGSDADAVTRQLTETFGVFEGTERAEGADDTRRDGAAR